MKYLYFITWQLWIYILYSCIVQYKRPQQSVYSSKTLKVSILLQWSQSFLSIFYIFLRKCSLCFYKPFQSFSLGDLQPIVPSSVKKIPHCFNDVEVWAQGRQIHDWWCSIKLSFSITFFDVLAVCWGHCHAEKQSCCQSSSCH